VIVARKAIRGKLKNKYQGMSRGTTSRAILFISTEYPGEIPESRLGIPDSHDIDLWLPHTAGPILIIISDNLERSFNSDYLRGFIRRVHNTRARYRLARSIMVNRLSRIYRGLIN